jgi:hypothetical protein
MAVGTAELVIFAVFYNCCNSFIALCARNAHVFVNADPSR